MKLVSVAAEVGPGLAAAAEAHDRTGTFVAGGIAALRAAGYLAAPVPADLGGGGATLGDVVAAQRELGRYCGSTALTVSMHLHVVLTMAWRWRRGAEAASAGLSAVAGGALVASTGGGDFLAPSGVARRVDGGWEVDARKPFVSGCEVADLVSTWVVADDGVTGLGLVLPMDTPGVRIERTWDGTGMRGTGSHDVVFSSVPVGADQVVAERRVGVLSAPLVALAAHAMTVIPATYLGVAVGARDVTRQVVARRSADPGVRRQLGVVEDHLAQAGWILDGVLAAIGADPAPTRDTFTRVMLAKRAVHEHARAAADVCMDVAGGGAYRRRGTLERAWRDLRAASYHPIDAEKTLRLAGAEALGVGEDELASG